MTHLYFLWGAFTSLPDCLITTGSRGGSDTGVSGLDVVWPVMSLSCLSVYSHSGTQNTCLLFLMYVTTCNYLRCHYIIWPGCHCFHHIGPQRSFMHFHPIIWTERTEHLGPCVIVPFLFTLFPLFVKNDLVILSVSRGTGNLVLSFLLNNSSSGETDHVLVE
jgi:hypothetical protein